MKHIYSALRALLVAMLVMTYTQQAHADVRHDEQVWITVSATGKITDKVVYAATVQPRTQNGISEVSLIQLRGALGLRVSPKITVFQGYSHFVLPRSGRRDLKEQHSFQQVNIALGKALGGELSSRTHLEQRWRSDGDDMALRLHQILRYRHPILKDSQSLQAVLQTEGFVVLNDTDWNGQSRFDQFRTFIGTEVSLVGPSTIEVGYLNQTVNLSGKRLQMNHIASIALTYRH